MTTKIYLLLNESNIPIYVGKTVRSLEKRLYMHIWTSKNRKVNTIISKKIRSLDYKISIKLIEEVSEQEDWRQKEIHYISEYSKKYKLYNETLGGDGSLGLNYHRNPNSKKVARYSLDGKLIDTFKSVREASEICRINFNQISNNLCLSRVKSGGGFIWKTFEFVAEPYIDSYRPQRVKHPDKALQVAKVVNNEIVEVYPSIAEAARTNNIHYSNMKKSVKLKRKNKLKTYFTLL